MRHCFLCIAMFFALEFVNAQGNEDFSDFDRVIQYINDLNISEEEDRSDQIDHLTYYYEHPIPINKATKDDLESIGLLSVHQISAILKFRSESGDFQSIYELQSIKEIDSHLFNIIRLFLVVDNHSSYNLQDKADHLLLIRSSRVLENQSGYDAKTGHTPFLGDREAFYLRYLYGDHYGTKAGFAMEKDPGEQWVSLNRSPGFDFNSGFVMHQDQNKRYRLLLGDYHLRFGQGVVTWTGMGVTGLVIEGSKRMGMGFIPYTSTNENQFFRGVVAEYSLGKVVCTVFGSRLNKDANLIFTNKNKLMGFSSLKNSGRHHTLSELMDKDALVEHNLGCAVVYKRKKFSLGTTNRYLNYNIAHVGKERIAKSNQNALGSLFYDVLYKNYNFFGEMGYNLFNGGYACVNGAMISLDPKLSFVVKSTVINKDFFSVYGESVRNTSVRLAEGILDMGIELKPHKKITVVGVMQLQSQMDPRNWYAKRTSVAWMQIGFDKKKSSFYMRYTNKLRHTRDIVNKDYSKEFSTKNNLRINFSYEVLDWLTLRNRVEFCSLSNKLDENEKGSLIFQDVKIKTPAVSVTIRYALFASDSYSSGIYAYENDLTYVFYTPNYYHTGSRFSVLMTKKLNAYTSVTVKFAQWLYEDRDEIGSGGDKINGNHKSELKLQLKVNI